MLGFFRFAAASPVLRVADPEYNAGRILDLYKMACGSHASVVVFPELSLTGFTCGDLFSQTALLTSSSAALLKIVEATAGKRCAAVVGIPLAVGARIFDAAAIISDGSVRGFAIRRYISGAGLGTFSPSSELPEGTVIFNGNDIPAGNELVFTSLSGVSFGVEIGADSTAALPPSTGMSLAGAHAVFNIGGGFDTAGSARFRREFVSVRSESIHGMYVYCGAGVHESTTDGVCSGHIVAAAEGRIVSESERFNRGDTIIFTDYKPAWAHARRRVAAGFNDSDLAVQTNPADVGELDESPDLSHLTLSPTPFVPEDKALLEEVCTETFEIQCAGLAKRMQASRSKRMVVGISGGLDSALALLVCALTCDRLALPRNSICAVTMPGFGTTDRTRLNAERLTELLGAELRVVSIASAIEQHFKDIGHDSKIKNTVYENSQARERTQILMDISNAEEALLVGTGDLSEAALGWCTFNGDHMSMYNVNCSLPKTLLRHMISCFAAKSESALAAVLTDINATPVSPELVPGGNQNTEKILGNYELHDFFLYYFIRYGETKASLKALAHKAFGGTPLAAGIDAALEVFMRRFASQQFKRSVSPDGPQVGPISLSPRCGWHAPSDYSPTLWVS